MKRLLKIQEGMARYCLVVCSLLLFGSAKAQSYNEGVVYLKVLPQYRTSCYKDSVSLLPLKNVYNQVQGTLLKKMFPYHQPPTTTYDAIGRKLVDISLIYKMEFSTSNSVADVIQKIQNTGTVEYADKDFIYETMYQPNDPISQPIAWTPWTIPNQNFLQLIKAQQAWDITKGDPSMVIGIVDTYFDITHPDLMTKFALNTADPVDGIDNDGDKYVDNYYGWHFGYNHGDVSASYQDPHGTEVAGAAAAETDNGVGVASTGFKSRFLAVAGYNYQGIAYAADHGAKIINLSWGGSGSYSKIGEDMVNYAAINKDVVIIAAAGNTPAELDFYPASYDNVMSVGASHVNTLNLVQWPIDIKTSWATWSTKIDILAPGNGVGTTVIGNSYDNGQGTSFSSPVVAGAAALVRWYYPFLKEFEVRELIRAKSDDVYGITGSTYSNMDYFEKLGKGRLNMEQPLLCDPNPATFYNCAPPAVRVINKKVYGLCGSTIPPTPLTFAVDFRNNLGNTSGVTVQVSSSDPDVIMNTSSAVLGAMNNVQVVNNVQFTFTLPSGLSTPLNKLVKFRLLYTYASGYTDYEYVDVNLQTQPTNSIWGPSNVCYNSRTGLNYWIGYLDHVSYNWTAPAGSTITFGGNSSSMSVDFGSQGGNLGVTLTSENGCIWNYTLPITIKCPPSVTFTNVQSSNNSLPANTSVTQYILAYDNVVVNTGTSVEFHANDYVVLEPGFKTEPSSVFIADGIGCTYCFNAKVASFNFTDDTAPIYYGSSALPYEEGVARLSDPELMVDVYPSPSTGTVTVRSKTPIKQILVTNLYGAKITKVNVDEECYEKTIDLTSQKPGLYTIMVNDGVNTYGDKVLVVK